MAAQTDRIIFYHIPKTGGIWVKYAMRRGGIKYGRARNRRRLGQAWKLKREHAIPEVIRPEDKENRLSFCFIRHPVDWYKSFWAYRKKTGLLDLEFPADKCWDEKFESFVLNVLEGYPDGFVTQLYQYYIGRDIDKIDYVGRQENLENDLVEVLYLAREIFDEKELRASKRLNIASTRKEIKDLLVLTKETIQKILQVENWVMDNFYRENYV